MSKDLVVCPHCGREVKKRGLSSHKRSARCLYIQEVKDLLERGFAPTTRAIASPMTHIPSCIPMEHGRRPGGEDIRGMSVNVWWLPKDFTDLEIRVRRLVGDEVDPAERDRLCRAWLSRFWEDETALACAQSAWLVVTEHMREPTPSFALAFRMASRRWEAFVANMLDLPRLTTDD